MWPALLRLAGLDALSARPDVDRVERTGEEEAQTAAAPSAGGAAAEAAPDKAELPRWNARRGIVRAVISVVVFFCLMALLAKLFGPRIEGAGQVFVERFGLAGLGFGMMFADMLSMPPPPLFYIVIVATSAGSHLPGMAVISVASMVAGFIGYHLASLLSARPFFRRRIDATRARMDPLFARYGVWAFAIASATPIPFSIMCYVAGVYRVRMRLLAFILVARIPRLLVMYWLVRAGWVTGSG